MNDIIVTSLLKIYGLITTLNKSVDKLLARSFVESFLRKNFSPNTVREQLLKFDAILHDLYKNEQLDTEKTIDEIGDTVNKELPLKQKYLILIYILQFVQHWQNNPLGIEGLQETTSTLVEKIVKALKLDMQEYSDLNNYIQNSHIQIHDKSKLLVVNDNPYLQLRGINTIQHANLEGEFIFYHLNSINAYLFKYKGVEKIHVQGRSIFPNHIYFFDKGTSVKGSKIKPLYYSAVVESYLSKVNHTPIHFNAIDIEFKFPKSENGIQKFSMSGSSGKMLGIMGGSGTGKSTLLNILNGSIVPNSGQIFINGANIHENKNELKGIMGYIPQDDLLIEELTVYQNLYYNAKLCLGNLNEAQIEERLNKILFELDLAAYKDLKVGNPLNKFISGGQRKRLNIALELIREPFVLFVDEPTSGLSSSDSERVMELLKEQALSGKYLVVNIHQPSSDIYKLFDDILVLDKGGYPIYFGNPIDAIEYVKTETGMVDAAESFCACCNTINPELVLQTIEIQLIDEFGKFTDQRRISPKEWYAKFSEKLQPKVKTKVEKIELPVSNLKLPNAFNQFNIYSIRNLLSKIADKQYLTISLFVSPLLALILSFLVRHLETGENLQLVYIFSENENIPAYIFMSIIVALFIGLIVSAEEIFRDRKIIKRESFLNLSQLSYYNSKIIFLFFISAIQTLSYTLIGHWVLELKGMTFSFWLVLFSLSCFSNMVGLNISSAFKSAVTIYIIIPLVLVPQILLGGVIVNFDQLQNSMASKESVPIIGDFMASRWAYEAMMVTQYKDNEYQKLFFEVEKQISQATFLMNYTIPRLINITSDIIKNRDKNIEPNTNATINYSLLNKEVRKIKSNYKFEVTHEKKLSVETPRTELVKLNENLSDLQLKLSKHASGLIAKKDKIIESVGTDKILKLKNENFNIRVSEFVLNNREINRLNQIGDKLIQNYEPIFLEPASKFGRSQFFAPYKHLGNTKIDTLWFNIVAIWLMTLFLYLALVFNMLKRIIR